MPFVRIGMAGIPVGELGQGARPEKRVVGAVLNLDQAEELALGTAIVMAHEPWGVAALANPAASDLEGDIRPVAGGHARCRPKSEHHRAVRSIRLVRMDFTGVWLGDTTPDDRELSAQGALFPDPVQLCSLISSMKKCVKAIRASLGRSPRLESGGSPGEDIEEAAESEAKEQ